ncbi:unnamed protein product [Prorocentrum cordatum]|uniref:Ion transport domain-containing protein n=2 Tax=Prorocentrum cordatum TaxID=2364126 RepID=A0ABN9STB4_9DINO|nr:unnamed protein product [Polarella glacialis]
MAATIPELARHDPAESPAMSPDLFWQKLSELAAEYESLHASSADRAGSRSPGSSPCRRKRPSLATSSAGLQPMTPATSADVVFARARSVESSPAPSSRGDGEGSSTLGSALGRSPKVRRAVSLMLARAARPRRAGLGLMVRAGSRSSGAGSGTGSFDEKSMQACPSVKEEDRFNAAVRRTQMTMRVNTPPPEDVRFLHRLVKSRGFSIVIACLIILSTVMIGIETQMLSSLSSGGSSSDQLIHILSAINYALTLLFTVEIVARLYVFRLDFFVHERVWNIFDVLILLLALVEIALEFVVQALSGSKDDIFDSGGSAKVLRLFRLTRLLRLVRTFRQLKPLRLLLHSLYCAGKSVIWALLLLLVIVYSFGVILTQAVTEHTEGGTRVEDQNLLAYYGDLYRSMLSLWWAVSGGISWNELTVPLEATGNSLWVTLFLVYIAFVYFFILNVVTGVSKTLSRVLNKTWS